MGTDILVKKAFRLGIASHFFTSDRQGKQDRYVLFVNHEILYTTFYYQGKSRLNEVQVGSYNRAFLMLNFQWKILLLTTNYKFHMLTNI